MPNERNSVSQIKTLKLLNSLQLQYNIRKSQTY